MDVAERRADTAEEHEKEHGLDESLSEEELDEISKKLIWSYKKKALKDRDISAAGQFFTPNGKKYDAERKMWSDRHEKRDRGIEMANRLRLAKEKK
jgi:hypothetical protein